MFMNDFDQLYSSKDINGDVLVLDIGKTHTKLVRYAGSPLDTHATAKQVARIASPSSAGPPYPSIAIADMFAWFGTQIQALPDKQTIAAILPITHGAAFALLDQNGDLAMPVMDYEFSPPDAFTRRYSEIRPPFAETGSPHMSAMLNAGRQLFYQQSEFPDRFADVSHIVPLAQYLGFLLGGALHSEVSALGCHTDLWMPEENRPSRLAVQEGWAAKFPAMAHGLSCIASLRDDISGAWGLPNDTVIFTGCHDSSFERAVLARQCEGAFASVSTGTWFVVTAPVAQQIGRPVGADDAISLTIDGDPVASARFMGGRMMAPFGDNRAWDAVRDVLFNPTFAKWPTTGEGRTPVFEGPLAENTDAQCAVAMLHIVLQTDHMLSTLHAPSTVIVTGPFADDPVFMALLQLASGRDGQRNVTTARSAFTPLAIPEDVPSSFDAYRTAWHVRTDAVG